MPGITGGELRPNHPGGLSPRPQFALHVLSESGDVVVGFRAFWKRFLGPIPFCFRTRGFSMTFCEFFCLSGKAKA